MSNDRALYEGMFLINPAEIGSNISTATDLVQQILDRAEAEAVAIFKWDDRKLSYEIKNQKRGLYMLACFKADGSKIAGIERDVNLSENMTRCMVLRADHIGETELKEAMERQEKTRSEAKTQSQEAAAAASAKEAKEAAEAPAPAKDKDSESAPAKKDSEPAPAKEADAPASTDA